MSGAAIGIAALRRISTGRVALVAAAICVATAPSPSFAADWTDANDPTVTYTALKSINGGGSGSVCLRRRRAPISTPPSAVSSEVDCVSFATVGRGADVLHGGRRERFLPEGVAMSA